MIHFNLCDLDPCVTVIIIGTRLINNLQFCLPEIAQLLSPFKKISFKQMSNVVIRNKIVQNFHKLIFCNKNAHFFFSRSD